MRDYRNLIQHHHVLGQPDADIGFFNMGKPDKMSMIRSYYEPIDDRTVRFSSIGRQVDGELLPNIGPVTVVRDVE